VEAPAVGGCCIAFKCTQLVFSERENGDLLVVGRIVGIHVPADGRTPNPSVT
jgi:hypothetical protein